MGVTIVCGPSRGSTASISRKNFEYTFEGLSRGNGYLYQRWYELWYLLSSTCVGGVTWYLIRGPESVLLLRLRAPRASGASKLAISYSLLFPTAHGVELTPQLLVDRLGMREVNDEPSGQHLPKYEAGDLLLYDDHGLYKV